MYRIIFTSAALLISTGAWAASPDTGAFAAPLSTAAETPSAQKVYPPLPSLAMLPPDSGADEADDDLRPSRATAAGAAKKHARSHRVVVVAERRPSGPQPYLVVSDESRAYLKTVEARLDAAFARQ